MTATMWLGRANDDHPDVEIQLRAAEIAPWLFDEFDAPGEEHDWTGGSPFTEDEYAGWSDAFLGHLDPNQEDNAAYQAGRLAAELVPIDGDAIEVLEYDENGQVTTWQIEHTPEILAWRGEHGIWPGDRSPPPVFECAVPRRFPMITLGRLNLLADLINRGSFHGSQLADALADSWPHVSPMESSDVLQVAEERGLISRGIFDPTPTQQFLGYPGDQRNNACCYHWITRTFRWMSAETFGFGTEIYLSIRAADTTEAV